MPEVKKQKKRKAFKMKKKVFRSSDPLLSVFMWGVHHTVSQLQHTTIPPLLLDADFKAFSKVSIENSNFNSDNMTGKFKFKEYCPIVFRNLREKFGVKENVFNQALSATEPYYECQGDKEKERGHKYFYSKCNRFVVKIFHSEEVEFMHSILNHYYNYAVEKGGKTLLPQYLAMYKITVSGVEYHMIVMRNVFAAHLTVHKKYDLKGSTVDREATDKDKSRNNPTLKDVDFLKDEMKVQVGEEKRTEILGMLESDVKFLSQLKIMDYSLLLGAHNVARGLEEQELEDEASSSDDLLDGEDAPAKEDAPMDVDEDEDEEEGYNGYTYVSADGVANKEVYFIGLIDVLTKYNATKRAAHTAKTMKHGAGAEISTVKPENYSKRFLEFMDTVFV